MQLANSTFEAVMSLVPGMLISSAATCQVGSHHLQEQIRFPTVTGTLWLSVGHLFSIRESFL